MIEADELWSFVADKRDVRWVWVALDAGTRQVVAMVVGDRSERTARQLWAALPHEYRDRATVHTDSLARYRAVVPPGRHVAAGKEAGLTNHVGRFWCTPATAVCPVRPQDAVVLQVPTQPRRSTLVLRPAV